MAITVVGVYDFIYYSYEIFNERFACNIMLSNNTHERYLTLYRCLSSRSFSWSFFLL